MTEPSPAQLVDLERAFQSHLEGEARFDAFSRTLYSTDASNHLIRPLGVVVPKTEEDLYATVLAAKELGLPLIPRGGGTGLAGQTLGPAVIVDCSKYLHSVVSVDPEAKIAEVQPGVVCAALNRAAAVYGLQYGPDPASANRATVGGMVGNNATGAHSIRYGMTADNIDSIDVVLSDGSGAAFGPMTVAAGEAAAARGGIEGQIYRTVLDLRRDYAEEIPAHWPRTWRRASGYGLNYLIGYSPSEPPAWYAAPGPYPPRYPLNLAPVLCGSEGTLSITRRVRLKLVEKPGHSVVVVLPFDSVAEATERTPGLLETEPSAIELLPRTLLERARSVPAYARRLTFVDEIPEALLIIEYAGPDLAALKQAAEPLAAHGRVLETAEAQADLWEVRKAGLGLLMSVPGDSKPITFIEDVAVPVELLSRYVGEVDRILTAHRTFGEWYAHASAGCLHLRPMINLKTTEGVQQMRGIAEAVAELVLELGGSLSGEHGDGYSHTAFNERLFGPELTQAFRKLKTAFDPDHRFNPGKVVLFEGDEPPALHKNLRYGGSYATLPLATHMANRREGSLAGAVEACTGLGVCRKDDGVMCPSYQATRDERHLTRGRANALRAAMSGVLPPDALSSSQMYEVFDLCLECKGCKAECPTAVDMARVKAEFLALYQAEHGLPFRSRLFGDIHRWSSLARPVSGLVNAMAGTRLVRTFQEILFGVARQRRLPRFVSRPFTRRFSDTRHAESGEPVLLFVDTYAQWNHPEIAEAAVKVLEAAGRTVLVERQQVCCGRPMISKGMLDRAKGLARTNIDVLAPYAERGVPIVVLEPSCLSTLQDEYLEFFPEDPDAAAVARTASLIETFLTTPGADGRRPIEAVKFAAGSEPIDVHVHCHAKSLVGSDATVDMLKALGAPVLEIDSGCCGMAGSFGYEAEHYELSMQIAELKVLPAVRRAEEQGHRVAAHGFSCRTQIRDGADVAARHPIELLAANLLADEG